MAPHRETTVGAGACTHKPPRLSMEGLQRTLSDVSIEMSANDDDMAKLGPISEAKCECCGMCEECTAEYVGRVRARFSGKLVCGLCAEAVEEEAEKSGRRREEAVTEHMSACSRFNSIGRTCPVLLQAEAMRELLKKSSCSSSSARAKRLSPRDNNCKTGGSGGGIARSSSCIPAITREISDRNMIMK